jgi:hypothetical protein
VDICVNEAVDQELIELLIGGRLLIVHGLEEKKMNQNEKK